MMWNFFTAEGAEIAEMGGFSFDNLCVLRDLCG
jgi:hypothetical protein